MNHFYTKIPGWFSFRGLYEQAVKEAKDGAHFVEVGSWKGRSAAFMAVEIINSGKKIRFDCVDTWQGSQEPKHLADESVKNGTLFEEFLKNMEPLRGICHTWDFIRMGSVEAAATFPNASLDFVFIDAAHDYENVLADIRAWWPKVKPGGVLAGDDYYFRGVKRAVEDVNLPGFVVEVVKGSGTGCAWRVRK